ncbi:hypothetical protein DFS34DRAFT_690280 [Phlyctochytrium arcticum]|nr:hypothetical protein DFS34DRAFT_690280 [Phlyctochytrium arcticum]
MMLFAGRKISDPFFSEIHSVIYTTLCPILEIEYPDIWEKVRTSRDATIKGNREGSFIAQVTQTLENRVTLLTDQFFTDRGWSVDALIFDGGMIRKQDGHDMTQELLDECSQFVFDNCGIHIKLAEKPLVVSDAFLEKFRLKYEPLEEEDDEEDDDEEPPKKKQKEDLNFEELRKLPSGKWKYFDFKRLYAPTHLNAAKWFIEEQCADSIMKHTSGFLYILGKDNIWRQYDTIGESDLNIQVAETLVSSFKYLIQEAEDDMQNVNDLRDVFKQFQRIIEMNDFSGNVAKNVDRLSIKNDNCIELFLSNPHLFAFTDGVYDLVKGEFRPFEAKDYILHTCGYPFPSGGEVTEIREAISSFFASIFPCDKIRDYRIAQLVRCLYGKVVEESFYVQKGGGRNGKGAETTLITFTFGTYFYFIKPENITTRSKGQRDAPNAQMFNCFGKRYLATSEPQVGQSFASDEIKIIRGNDPYPVRTLHGKPITFPMTGALHIQTNEDPKFDRIDTAIALSAKMIPYTVTFAECNDEEEDMAVELDDDEDEQIVRQVNPNLKKLFSSPEYRDTFILILMRFFKSKFVKKDGSLDFSIKVPEEVNEYTKKNLVNSLTVAKWFKMTYQLTNNPEDKIERTAIYDKYLADNVGSTTLCERNTFYKELRAVVSEKRTKTTRYFVGIEWKNE